MIVGAGRKFMGKWMLQENQNAPSKLISTKYTRPQTFFKMKGSYSLSVQYYKKSIKIKTSKANVIYAKMHKVATFFTQKL